MISVEPQSTANAPDSFYNRVPHRNEAVIHHRSYFPDNNA
uniref:Uncharacterized protein n=1 Tax=Parascaris equorum TaxID=6256 RepID=A0A914RB99_PAREQ